MNNFFNAESTAAMTGLALLALCRHHGEADQVAATSIKLERLEIHVTNLSNSSGRSQTPERHSSSGLPDMIA
jgi:hypothetical protein